MQKTIVFKFAMLMTTTCVVMALNVNRAEPRLALIHQNEEDDKSVQLTDNFKRDLNIGDGRPGKRFDKVESFARDAWDIVETRGISGDSKTRKFQLANKFGRDLGRPRISLLLDSRDWSSSNIVTKLDDSKPLLNGDSVGNRRRAGWFRKAL